MVTEAPNDAVTEKSGPPEHGNGALAGRRQRHHLARSFPKTVSHDAALASAPALCERSHLGHPGRLKSDPAIVNVKLRAIAIDLDFVQPCSSGACELRQPARGAALGAC